MKTAKIRLKRIKKIIDGKKVKIVGDSNTLQNFRRTKRKMGRDGIMAR